MSPCTNCSKSTSFKRPSSSQCIDLLGFRSVSDWIIPKPLFLILYYINIIFNIIKDILLLKPFFCQLGGLLRFIIMLEAENLSSSSAGYQKPSGIVPKQIGFVVINDSLYPNQAEEKQPHSSQRACSCLVVLFFDKDIFYNYAQKVLPWSHRTINTLAHRFNVILVGLDGQLHGTKILITSLMTDLQELKINY